MNSMPLEPSARLLTGVSLGLASLLLSSCASIDARKAPRVPELSSSGADNPRRREGPERRTAEPPGGGPSLSAVAAEPAREAPRQVVPTMYRSGDFSEENLGGLVREVDRLLHSRWRELRGAVPGRGASPEGRGLGRRLVALSFLKPESEARTTPRPVLDSLLGEEESVESRLLAAAFLGRTGRTDERDALLRKLFYEMFERPLLVSGGGAEPNEDTGVFELDWSPEALLREQAAFRIRGLAFAAEISGLGSYTARDDSRFAAGEEALIYGEFTRFRERVEYDSGEPTYFRKLAAVLTLLDGEGESLDEGEFLSAEEGSFESSHPRATINFWARYRFPADLEPGDYRLRIAGRDLEGRQDAAAELPVTILPPGS